MSALHKLEGQPTAVIGCVYFCWTGSQWVCLHQPWQMAFPFVMQVPDLSLDWQGIHFKEGYRE